MIRYYKLFDLLNRRGMKKSDLLAVISAPTIAKLSKGDVIKSDTIDKICLYLDCQPSDIMEVFYDNFEEGEDGITSYFKSIGDIDVGYSQPEDLRSESYIDENTSLVSVLTDPVKWERYRINLLKKYQDKPNKP